MSTENNLEFILTINALWFIGAVPVPLNIRLSENELIEMVEFSDLDGLRTRAEEKRKDLAVEKDELEAKKTALTFTLQEIENATKFLNVSL